MYPDSRLAAELAERAGELLLEVRTTPGLAPEELAKRGDGLANEWLLSELARRRPADAVLSEESADNPARLASARVWIIDPLDGSREFGVPGRSDWAVHVALWEADRGITAAAVAQPALGAVYADDEPPPSGRHVAQRGPERPSGRATLHNLARPRAIGPRPRILVSDSRPPAFTTELAAEVDAEVATMGSAGAKTMSVLRGEADAYVHAGGQWEWDSAAPVGVALAAGLHASRIDGSALQYNQTRPYLPDLLICRSELARPLLTAIRRVLAE